MSSMEWDLKNEVQKGEGYFRVNGEKYIVSEKPQVIPCDLEGLMAGIRTLH